MISLCQVVGRMNKWHSLTNATKVVIVSVAAAIAAVAVVGVRWATQSTNNISIIFNKKILSVCILKFRNISVLTPLYWMPARKKRRLWWIIVGLENHSFVFSSIYLIETDNIFHMSNVWRRNFIASLHSNFFFIQTIFFYPMNSFFHVKLHLLYNYWHWVAILTIYIKKKKERDHMRHKEMKKSNNKNQKHNEHVCLYLIAFIFKAGINLIFACTVSDAINLKRNFDTTTNTEYQNAWSISIFNDWISS